MKINITINYNGFCVTSNGIVHYENLSYLNALNYATSLQSNLSEIVGVYVPIVNDCFGWK